MSTTDQNTTPEKPKGFQKWFGYTVAIAILVVAAIAFVLSGGTPNSNPSSDQSSDGITMSNP